MAKTNEYGYRGSGKRTAWTASLLCGILLWGCQQVAIYEKNTALAHQGWPSNQLATGGFNIADTAANYRLYVVMRHTDTYPYENIWLRIGLQAPGDSMRYERYNLSLVNGQQGWEGTGMSDIWEVRKPIQTAPGVFKKKGLWQFSIAHLMRNDPLPAVLSAGLRVEKQP
jgi:gliding motility-associated lipoprotein GldH